MASAKTKNDIKQPNQKAFENRKSSELLSEIEDMRLGMERRKFSYTIHIPERRSGQNSVKLNNHFKTRHRLNLLYVK
jgi:hypothetical protein